MFRADRLTERRKLHKLTQEQLAQQVNLTKAAISNYEQGRSAPPHETLALLVDALHTNADYLLGLSDSPAAASAAQEPGSSSGHRHGKTASRDGETGSAELPREDEQASRRKQAGHDSAPEPGVYIAYLGGPPEEMDEEEAEHLKRELEMFRAFKEKRRQERESKGRET